MVNWTRRPVRTTFTPTSPKDSKFQSLDCKELELMDMWENGQPFFRRTMVCRFPEPDWEIAASVAPAFTASGIWASSTSAPSTCTVKTMCFWETVCVRISPFNLPPGAVGPTWNGGFVEAHYTYNPQLILIGRYETVQMSRQANPRCARIWAMCGFGQWAIAGIRS